MYLQNYPLSSEEDLTTFEFVSEGPKGLIRKIVQFTPTNLKGLYILAFGDKDAETGHIDDLAITNNNDTEKVLATVVATVYAFTDNYSNAWIYATGSTKARIRLYRIYRIFGKKKKIVKKIWKIIKYVFLHFNSFNMKRTNVIKEIEKRKVPIVRIDKSLNKYKNIVLFPDKLEKANEMLRTVGLPKQWIKQ